MSHFTATIHIWFSTKFFGEFWEFFTKMVFQILQSKSSKLATITKLVVKFKKFPFSVDVFLSELTEKEHLSDLRVSRNVLLSWNNKTVIETFSSRIFRVFNSQ